MKQIIPFLNFENCHDFLVQEYFLKVLNDSKSVIFKISKKNTQSLRFFLGEVLPYWMDTRKFGIVIWSNINHNKIIFYDFKYLS